MLLLEELKTFSLERVVKLTCTHQCCGSGMFIPELGSKNSNKRGVKKISCHTIFSSHKFDKILNYFILKC